MGVCYSIIPLYYISSQSFRHVIARFVYSYIARFFFPQLSTSSLTLSVRIPYPYSHTYTDIYVVSSAC